MNTGQTFKKDAGGWAEINFFFADNSLLTPRVRITDGEIMDIAIDPGQAEFRLKNTLNDIYGLDALHFSRDAFPHLNLWFKYAEVLVVEKHLKQIVPESTELLRIIIFEFLRIAEYVFCLATFSLNAGLNREFSGLLELYNSFRQFLKISGDTTVLEEFVTGTKGLTDLPIGFTERALIFLEQFKVKFLQQSTALLSNRIILDRCFSVCHYVSDQIAHLSGPNLRAVGVNLDRRRDFPYSLYQRLSFDRIQPYNSSNDPGECWHRLRIRCEEVFTSIGLIRQSIAQFVYQTSPINSPPGVRNFHKGHSSVSIETPWGNITCQLNCAGGKDICEFTLTNPLHEILIYLRQTAVGLELTALPLHIASLGLRPKMEPL
ncbi:MAG: hypothetical protein V1681_03240 [Candidatus Neomarinimicrobiota bacterium]